MMALAAWVAAVAAVAGVAWLYSWWRHNYWAARGVTTPPITPFLGHMHKMINVNPGRFLFDYEVYTRYGGSKYCGLYGMHKPILFIGDLNLLKQILVKDFDHFTDRRTFDLAGKRDRVLKDMLTLKTGAEWKALRALISPTFSSGKIKSMFPIVCKKADILISYSLQQASEDPHVEMKDNFGRFTMDTIATCAFGIECNSFEDKYAEFASNASEFFNFGPMKLLKMIMVFAVPKLFSFLKMNFHGPELDFFANVVKQTMSVRQESKRGDFLDLLLEAQAAEESNDNSKKVISDKSIVAQSIMFLVVGYDTTASTLAFSCYELAKSTSEQRRLKEELLELVKEGDGELTYQGIMEAKFLDACIMETLRIYPPLVTTERVCTKPYQLPETNLVLNPGDLVQIPIWCVHHDPSYWPDPDQFRPDRFMPENKANIKSFTHFPFGMGPRNCIAMWFALLEAKVALAKLVLAAEMTLAAGQEQLELVTGSGVIRPKHGVKLLLKPHLKS